MDRDALGLAARRSQHDRLLAEHEYRHAAEKMRGDDRTARRNRMDAFDDGGGVVAGVGHSETAVSRLPKSRTLSTRMRQPPDTTFTVPVSIGSVAAHAGVQNVNSISQCGSNSTWRDQADPYSASCQSATRPPAQSISLSQCSSERNVCGSPTRSIKSISESRLADPRAQDPTRASP